MLYGDFDPHPRVATSDGTAVTTPDQKRSTFAQGRLLSEEFRRIDTQSAEAK